MALTDSEIAEIKAELGYNLLTTGALPYIGVTQVFEQVIKDNVGSGASTTSSTTVTAATSHTPVTLVIASATGLATGDRVVIDVDSRKETATIQDLTGTNMTVLLKLAHTGTYPVVEVSGETRVRETLDKLRATKTELGGTFGEGALKKVDEIEFYNTRDTLFGSTGNALKFWRNELASILGIPNAWDYSMGSSQRFAVY